VTSSLIEEKVFCSESFSFFSLSQEECWCSFTNFREGESECRLRRSPPPLSTALRPLTLPALVSSPSIASNAATSIELARRRNCRRGHATSKGSITKDLRGRRARCWMGRAATGGAVHWCGRLLWVVEA
jgi:hypothetical protein